MAELRAEDVRKAVLGALGDDSVVELSRDQPKGRITGWVMNSKFKQVSRADRQSWLWGGLGVEDILPPWEGLRNTFKERSTQIGLVLTYSPAEYENAFGEGAQSA